MKPLALVASKVDDELREKLSDCFVIGESRTFDSDPRFGMIVLGEIGDKAMSAGINDPGTGIVVIDTGTRLLLDWKEERQEVRHDRVFVRRIRPADVLDDVYRPTARDGAAILEVMIRLMKSLETVAECNPAFTQAAHDFARQALRRAEAAMTLDDDFEVLKKVADWVEPA